MSNISFCIPSKNNLRYLKTAIHYLRLHCNPAHEILVWIDKDDDGTSAYLKELNDANLRFWVNENEKPFGIGNAYNFLVSNASNKLVMMYHADMIAAPDMDVEVLKHIAPKVVVSATRIEPPLHPGDPAKITENFGLWPETDVVDGFNHTLFIQKIEQYKKEYQDKTTPGIFAPWVIYKEDYDALGGHDERLNSLAEDIDIFNRMDLAGYTFIQPWKSFVYHLTCRGGQFEHAKNTNDLKQKSNDWNVLSYVKTREFIRKWGFGPMAGELREPMVWPQIPRKLKLRNCDTSQNSYNILQAVEPYFTEVSIDNIEMQTMYIQREQPQTSYDLQEKFNSWTADLTTIDFDARNLRAEHFNEFITRLPLVLSTIEEVGKYEYDIFTIEVSKV